MKIYNTLSQRKEEFVPLCAGKIGMYVCGPTVYDVGHLGHARAAVSFDVIRRYLSYRGYNVTFVSNYTDVDDKMIKRAFEEGVTEKELSERIIPEYEKDYGALRIMKPDHQPKATQYISKMVKLVDKLLKMGIAYATPDGVYFEVSKFREYGKLSHQRLDELKSGARIEVDENKKNPIDFALWKKAKEGEPKWPGPNGIPGRPGWHIECSAMSMDILGETFDIHGGGIDLQFPHHECEIAQSEMSTGVTFVRYWLHNGHIRVNREKMSKSLGNFFTIKEILAKYNPLVVRYFLLSAHYRMPVEFSSELLEQAKAGLERLHDFMGRLQEYVKNSHGDNEGRAPQRGGENGALLQKTRKSFEKAMDDDFEISKALAEVFDLVKHVNTKMDKGKLSNAAAAEIMELMNRFDSVLGVLHSEENSSENDEAIQSLVEARNKARVAKDFKKADKLRAILEKQGIILEDTSSGTKWKRSL